MAKKKPARNTEKTKKCAVSLSPEDARDLEIIFDRLLVQNPNGETLNAYVESLYRALKDRHAMVCALIDRLGRNPDEIRYKVLMGLKKLFTDKVFRKAVRQAEYRFEQRGFGGGGEADGDPVVLIRKEKAGENLADIIPAHELFLFVTLLINDESVDGPTSIHVMMDWKTLDLEVFISEVSLRSYRQVLEEADLRFGVKHYRVPFDNAVSLFFEMLDNGVGGANSASASHARRLLKPYLAAGARPRAYDLIESEGPPKITLTKEDQEAFLNECRLEGLLVADEELTKYHDRFHDSMESGLLVSQDLQMQRFNSICEQAADDLFTGKRGKLLARFFEEEALRLKLARKDDAARGALDVARALRDGTLPSDISVLPYLIKVQMILDIREDLAAQHGPGWEDWRPDMDEEPLEEPDDAPVGFERSASGLIIPKGR